MKRLHFLPILRFTFAMILASSFLLTFTGNFGCGVKLETPNALDQALQGNWVAERLSNDGSRVVIGFNMDDQGVRHAGVMSVPIVGTASVISEGTYSIRSGNMIYFNFDTLNSFQALQSWLNPQKTRLSLQNDVYTKVSTASGSGATLGGQVQVGPSATDASVGVGALGLSDVSQQNTDFSSPSPVTPDVLVTMRDGSVKRVMIQPQTPPAALSISDTSSVVNQINQVIDTKQAVEESIVHSIEELKRDPNVLSVTPNVLLQTQSISAPTDPLYNQQWNLSLLNMVDAWQQTVGTTGNPLAQRDITVAVIDTGIVTSPRPADLGDRVLYDQGYDFVDDQYWSDIEECQHQTRAALKTWRDFDEDNTPGPDNDATDPGDAEFHGTHVAGLIASGLDNGGMVGMTGPVGRIKILPLRTMGRCGDGYLFNVSQAILYAAKILPNMGDCTYTRTVNNVNHTITYTPPASCPATTAYNNRKKADIINLSLGGFVSDYAESPLSSAISRAKASGVLIIAASGNQGKGPGWCKNDTTGNLEPNVSCNFYPAADSDNVLAVGAVYPNLTLAAYSNFTSQSIQPHFIVAPGGSTNDGIMSLTRIGEPDDQGGGYKELSGTSMATPHVSGIAALAMSLSATPLSPDQVRSILETSAISLNDTTTSLNGHTWDAHFGYGLLNPVGALMAANGGVPSGTSHLSLSATEIAFGPLGNQATILATSSNGSALSGLVIGATTTDGHTWLRVTSSTTSTPARLNVQINRTGLANGNYTGAITVNSTAGSQRVAISMTVSTQSTSGDSIENLRRAIEALTGTDARSSSQDIGEMTISLIDPNTGEEVYYTKTDYQADYRFLMGVEPGQYYLKAVVDENENRVIDPGEPTFAYPNTASPQIIDVSSVTFNRTNYILGP